MGRYGSPDQKLTLKVTFRGGTYSTPECEIEATATAGVDIQDINVTQVEKDRMTVTVSTHVPTGRLEEMARVQHLDLHEMLQQVQHSIGIARHHVKDAQENAEWATNMYQAVYRDLQKVRETRIQPLEEVESEKEEGEVSDEL